MTINIREKVAAIDLGLGLDLVTRIGNAVDQVFHHHEPTRLLAHIHELTIAKTTDFKTQSY
jgi:hypothetical protein